MSLFMTNVLLQGVEIYHRLRTRDGLDSTGRGRKNARAGDDELDFVSYGQRMGLTFLTDM